MKAFRPLRGLGVVALVAALALLGWTAWRASHPAAEAVAVRSGTLVRSLVVSGRVAAESRVPLGATVTGRVQRVTVREGDRVGAGDLLVQLEDAESRAMLAQAEAALAGAQARLSSQQVLAAPVAEQQLAQAQANAEAAARELQRQESLFAQGFIGQARLDELRRAAAVAASQRDAARTQVRAQVDGAELESVRTRVQEARAAVELARARLAQARIVAPADGTVLTRHAEPGQIVAPGTRLLEMSLAGPVQLVAQIDEKHLATIALGQPASVVADAFPGQPFAARVHAIAPVVDVLRGSVEVKFTLDELPAFLKSDMTLSIEIVTARRERTLVLPSEALRGDDRVMLERHGRAVLQPVKTGLRTLESVEILDGLADAELVLVDPAVVEGQRVRAVPRAPRSRAASGGLAEGVGAAIQVWSR